MRAIGTSRGLVGMLVACVALASAAWAADVGGTPAALGLTKQGASGQVYVWQTGSC